MAMDNRPIGVFDSGVGGLTVLREIMKQLPGEDLVYFGDTARVPYGSKPKDVVVKYVIESCNFLKTKNVKAIVIACNTATALAIEEAQEIFDVPIIGVVEPGAKAAASVTKNNIIGIIATEGTIKSGAYKEKIMKLIPEAKIFGVPCPLFVPIIEEGWESTDVAYLTASKYLDHLKKANIDTLVLGCTHYPVLRDTINKIMGDNITLVDPAFETVKIIKNILIDNKLLNEKTHGGTYNYYVSQNPEKFKKIGENIIKKSIDLVEKVELEDL